MSWEKLAQNRIEEALASSEFEDLPGRGLPLDLDAYFALPPTERAGAALEAAHEQTTEPKEKARHFAQLQEKRVTCTRAVERRRRESAI